MAGPINQAHEIVARVWYGGDDAVAAGIALYFDADYGTVADNDASRINIVEKPPSAASSLNFAGISKGSYRAVTGGQFVDIYCPGSRGVPLQLEGGIDSVNNLTTLMAVKTTGTWTDTTEEGRGVAYARSSKDAATPGALCIADLLTGDGATFTIDA